MNTNAIKAQIQELVGRDDIISAQRETIAMLGCVREQLTREIETLKRERGMLVDALKQAVDCIEDVGAPEWEGVCDEMRAAISATDPQSTQWINEKKGETLELAMNICANEKVSDESAANNSGDAAYNAAICHCLASLSLALTKLRAQPLKE